MFLRHLYVQKPHAPSARLSAATFHRLHPCGNYHSSQNQGAEGENGGKRDVFLLSTLGSQDNCSLGWWNTKLLAHQAGESDTCFWLDRRSI